MAEAITTLPLVGASMTAKELPVHVDWLIAHQRDLEIQDPVFTPIFDNDWRHLDQIPGLSDGITYADWRRIAQTVRAQLNGYKGRLSIHGPFVGLPLMSLDREIRQVVSRRLRQALAFAEEIGATQMVLHSPWTFLGGPYMPYASIKGQQQVIALTLDLVEPLLPIAKSAGCTLVFEGVFDKHPQPLLDLVKAFSSDYVRISVDTGHAYINHVQGGPSVDHWITTTAPFLAHLHLQDGDGCADRHWAPGRGDINWYAVFEALEAVDSMPRLILETRRFREGAEWLAAQNYIR